jgi:hypothetical protein
LIISLSLKKAIKKERELLALLRAFATTFFAGFHLENLMLFRYTLRTKFFENPKDRLFFIIGKLKSSIDDVSSFLDSETQLTSIGQSLRAFFLRSVTEKK